MKNYSFQEVLLAENSDFILSTNPSGTILYQEHLRNHSWSRFELKEILHALSSHRFNVYIIKVNHGSLLPPDDLAWVERLNLKRLLTAGISHVAYVSPQNVFTSLELEKEVQPGKIFRIRIFKKMTDAVQWLEITLHEELTYRD